MEILTTFCVLDYEKPEESRICLQSIKNNANFPHKVNLLCNGSKDYEYAISLYREGLIDKLILSNTNSGCGNGTVEIINTCETPYFFYIQNDQELIFSLNTNHINQFIDSFNQIDLGYIDLAGGQAGDQVFSERAGFFKTEFYKSIPKGEPNKLGGPGPFNDKRYVESFVQEYFKVNSLKIIHYNIFKDLGKWSIRQMGDGIYKHRCDSKEMNIIKLPTYRTEVYPPFNDLEWEMVLSGNWVNGTIPDNWKSHSFKYWND